jgi:hypothetical protein
MVFPAWVLWDYSQFSPACLLTGWASKADAVTGEAGSVFAIDDPTPAE